MLITVLVAEYLRRVRTKAFVLTTLLGPLAIAAVMGGAGFAVMSSVESETLRERRVAVLDGSGRILPRLREQDNPAYRLYAVSGSLEAAKQAVIGGEAELLLVLPRELADPRGPTDVTVYVAGQQAITATQTLRRFVLDVVRDVRLAQYDLPPQVLATINERLSFTSITLSEEGEEQGSLAVSVVVGLAVAIVILLVMTVYGGLVMQTAMEEKTSRMAEILVSSVRPFDLLMGKILAIGGVAVTQLAVWIPMLAAIAVTAAMMVPVDELAELGLAGAGRGVEDGGFTVSLSSVRFDVALVVLVMLPLGYLINASLFGALGAMYETPQEAQVAVTIAMAPMIAAIIMVQTAGLAPNSSLIAFGSFFPFTAPAMLPTRMLIADVPVWQVAASVVLCLGMTVAVVWLAGRIFRGSLLIYGKKLKVKDIWQILTVD